MAGTTTNGDRRVQPRTGARVLALFAVPLNVVLLRELETGPKLTGDLRRAAGFPPRRVLRAHLRLLERLGILVKSGSGLLPGLHDYELAKPGRELRFVKIALERWLTGNRPERLELATDGGTAAIEAVLGGWSSQIMRAVAARPRSLTELQEEVASLGRAELERRVEAMRRTRLLDVLDSGEGAPPTYVRTAWLCRAMGPIVAASRWERDNLPDPSAPIGQADAETALLLTVPLLELPPTARGTCRLTVDVAEDSGEPPAMVTLTADGRHVIAYEPAAREAAASASGPLSAWFRAAIEAEPGQIEVDGDRRLARNLLDALYIALYGLRAPRITHML